MADTKRVERRGCLKTINVDGFDTLKKICLSKMGLVLINKKANLFLFSDPLSVVITLQVEAERSQRR
jgi:hypothetical protein